MFAPDKDAVLHRWAHKLGPQRTAAHLLSHLGDEAILKPFAPGNEPNWLEALAVLLSHNEHISLDEVIVELRRTEPKALSLTYRRKAI